MANVFESSQEHKDRERKWQMLQQDSTALLADLPDLTIDTDDGRTDSSFFRDLMKIVDGIVQSNAIRFAYLSQVDERGERRAINDSFCTEISWTIEVVREELSNQDDRFGEGFVTRKVIAAIESALRRLQREIGSWPQAYHSDVEVQLSDALGDLRSLATRIEVRSITSFSEQARTAAETATRSATAASEAAGLTADAGMATHFETLGQNHEEDANQFRIATLSVMGLGGLVAALFLIGPSFGWSAFNIAPDDYVHLAQRILLLAGVFGLAGYLGRQAHNHRTMSNWALSLAAQLKTFDAYNSAIDDDGVKNDVRRQFATRVFGNQPGLKGETTSPDDETIVNKAADLVAKIMPGDKS